MNEQDGTVALDQRRNVLEDAERDHAAIVEQLTDRRDRAQSRRDVASDRLSALESDVERWADQVTRYQALLDQLGPVPTSPEGKRP